VADMNYRLFLYLLWEQTKKWIVPLDDDDGIIFSMLLLVLKYNI